jgi:TRAP-type C4-dicarboxylate transport system permease small subunit
LGFAALVTYKGIAITYVQARQEADLVPISMAWIYAVVPFTGIVMVIYLLYLLFFWTEPQADKACEWLPDEEES